MFAARARRSLAPPFLDPPGYAHHRPEATLLYQLVERHYPAFRELRAEAGKPLAFTPASLPALPLTTTVFAAGSYVPLAIPVNEAWLDRGSVRLDPLLLSPLFFSGALTPGQ